MKYLPRITKAKSKGLYEVSVLVEGVRYQVEVEASRGDYAMRYAAQAGYEPLDCNRVG
jgi:hypothetical protein